MKHRPWHALKTEDRLQSEDTGLVRKDQYYLNGDEFKLLALIVAVEDRNKHGIVATPPALMDGESFRDSFSGGEGTMLALRNDADLVSAATAGRERFQITSGHPLERMLAQTDVTAPAAPSVEVTHATSSGSGGTGLTIETEAPPAISPSAGMRTPDQRDCTGSCFHI